MASTFTRKKNYERDSTWDCCLKYMQHKSIVKLPEPCGLWRRRWADRDFVLVTMMLFPILLLFIVVSRVVRIMFHFSLLWFCINACTIIQQQICSDCHVYCMSRNNQLFTLHTCLQLKNWDCDPGPYASVESLSLNRKAGSVGIFLTNRHCVFLIFWKETLKQQGRQDLMQLPRDFHPLKRWF